MNTARKIRARLTAVAVATLTALYVGIMAPAAVAASTCTASTPCAAITGAGSTWAYNAIHLWDANMTQFGVTVNYQPNGSRSGRVFFADGQADWAASEIPYGVVDGANTDSPPSRGFAYMPDVAGGLAFMYNLQINGQQVTNLRLSGAVIAGIFTNKITFWDDPAIKADNPQLALPHRLITPGGPLRRRRGNRGVHPMDARHRSLGLAGVLRGGRPVPVHADVDGPGPAGDGHDRPIRRPWHRDVRGAGLVERGDRLRPVLLGAARGFPGRQDAQLGGLLHRADRG
jgi:hypothetical protein